MFACFASLRAYVLTYLACLRAYVLACLVRLRAYVLGELTCFRACVLTWLACLARSCVCCGRVPGVLGVLTCLVCLRARVLGVLLCLRGAYVLAMMKCFTFLRVRAWRAEHWRTHFLSNYLFCLHKSRLCN